MDPALRLLAATYIRRQAKQLDDQLDGALSAADNEYVHRARVAARRLRAAFRLFHDCFGPKRMQRWRKAIRRITSALGDARDRDVQVEFLCGTLSALTAKECFPGIAHILVELEHDREQLQRAVIRAVKRLRRKHILREMEQTAKKVGGDGGAPGREPTPQLLARIEQRVCGQLSEMLKHRDSLKDPDDQVRHHSMRIAAKRLRYTLEIARPVYPDRLDETIAALKRVQTMLGDIHDCDVWWDYLDEFTARERQRMMAMFGHPGRFLHQQAGIEYLQRDRHHHRQQVFEELVRYWAELGQRQFWDQLTATVRRWGQSAPAADVPADDADRIASRSPADGNGAGSDRPPAAKPLLTTGS